MPKFAYHGTTQEAVPTILEQGLRGAFGYVYMTPDLAMAKRFGEVVLRIDLSMLDPQYLGTYHEMMCDLFGTDDFIHYGDTVPPSALTVLK